MAFKEIRDISPDPEMPDFEFMRKQMIDSIDDDIDRMKKLNRLVIVLTTLMSIFILLLIFFLISDYFNEKATCEKAGLNYSRFEEKCYDDNNNFFNLEKVSFFKFVISKNGGDNG